ncbi:YtnP family quorum-quenching lactonase [Cytobacillus purgationiresistens]|uniref:Glyoxylase-like metal-dependent hydrolase (Beta-lactamase superfamily II) n=1 Tax=Cytobacillus purgationiresistens TaxID=863449 RepID=A0ABU0AMX6_9BACI|nr:MBL fold metallo-hydrolase [Cytobacillus purgationiresistens]MDQ0272224.1 glyoxylase-like metal-dependent hydrolase (beta-lactamase superfamily II) [Cytobacillus purgationiresistens]
METLQIDDLKFTWLRGGVTHLDGGAMFGVVPKPLWSRKYPSNDNNQIQLRTDPILIQWEGQNILVESGLGNNKMDEKQKRNYGALEESKVDEDLQSLGLTPEDIDYILMTHLHFDHACGLTKQENDGFVSAFPNAKIVSSKIEWDEMRNPNIRSRNTYWKENWEAITNQVIIFEGEWSLGPIRMVHTGGHSDGHSILVIETGEQLLIHMADIMPTHAHQNVLWVLAFDDYPMDSISAKQKWMKIGLEKNAWFLFYHDAIYRAVKWEQDGKKIAATIEREK